MTKKIIVLLFLPYLTFMFLEGCYNNQCDRRETRNITDLYLTHQVESDSSELIFIQTKYESYFVNNYKINVLPKTYARDIDLNPCFEGYSNPIKTISITSANDYDSYNLAGSEINGLFVYSNSNKKLDQFEMPSSYNYSSDDTELIIYNGYVPTLDSIHTLYFNIYCADGKTYLDTLTNVNLNRTNNWNYY